MNGLQIKSNGRRHYIVGNTFSVKDALRAAGCRWDADEKAWWTGKKDVAEELVTQVNQAVVVAVAALPEATGAMVPVPGNTYPARDKLREMGGVWDAALLSASLSVAVPLWIERVRSLSVEERLSRARICGQVVAEKGDILQFRSKKKGETAEAFNRLAEGLACAAFVPGGVRFFDLYFEAET
jgi:hypothetical protein